MFLTTCAVCAKAIDDEVEAPRRCEPCGTRYCGDECEREGRDHDCDAIVRAGGAEAAYVTSRRRLHFTKRWWPQFGASGRKIAMKSCR